MNKGKFIAWALLPFFMFWGPEGARAQMNLTWHDHQTYHFGFLIGLGLNSFNPTFPADYQKPDSLLSVQSPMRPGFSLGIVANYRLGKYSDLRLVPTLAFMDRGLDYRFKDPQYDKQIVLESTYLELPLSVKFKTERMRNIRLYSTAGVRYGRDVLFKNRRILEEDVINNPIRLGRDDLALEYGVGIDLYYPFFKFTPELKFRHGLDNLVAIIEPNRYNTPFHALRSTAVILSLYFE